MRINLFIPVKFNYVFSKIKSFDFTSEKKEENLN